VQLPAGAAWAADLSLGGSGTSWANMDWAFRANQLSITGPRPVKLDGLAATVETRGDLVTLTGVTGPGNVGARGRGNYNLATRDWDARLDLSNLPRPAGLGPAAGPLALTFNARGSDDVIIFDNPGLSLRGSEAEARIEGSYVFDVPQPVDVVLYVNHIPRRGQPTDQPPVFGYLRGEAKLLGTAMRPTNISIDGHLVGRDVRFLDRDIGDLEADLTGNIDDERLTLKTEQLEMLGGRWQLDALFPQDGVLGMNLSVDELSLKEVGDALKQPGLEGTVDARWAFHVPRLQAEAVKVTGDVRARGLKYRGTPAADSLEATVLLADGELSADPVKLRKGDGEADVAAVLDVREFRRMNASVALAAWPFEPSPGTRAELWGGTTGLRVALPGATREEGVRDGVFRPQATAQKLYLRGPIDLRAAFTLKDQPAGDAHLLADFRGRTLDLRNLAFDGLDGTVQGQALVNLDRPLEARGTVFFENFNAARLTDFFPENEVLVGLGGRFSGRARLSPSNSPRALEPLRLQVEVASDAGRYRTIDVGPMRISAFTNLDRFVVQDSPENPTTLELAGGLVRVWGRLSLLKPGDELDATATTQPLVLSQMQVSFGRLDLDQIVHAFTPDADPMPGRLSGSFEALAGTRPRRRAGEGRSGQTLLEKVVRRVNVDGRVELTEAELGNLDVVAFFYNALNTIGGGGGAGRRRPARATSRSTSRTG
jgi:hypothetical protein